MLAGCGRGSVITGNTVLPTPTPNPTEVTSEYAIPTANSFPAGLVKDADGTIWFTEKNGNKLGQLTTAATFNEYTIPTTNAQPVGITIGPDNFIWFTESNADQIGELAPSGTAIVEYAIPTA